MRVRIKEGRDWWRRVRIDCSEYELRILAAALNGAIIVDDQGSESLKGRKHWIVRALFGAQEHSFEGVNRDYDSGVLPTQDPKQ